MTLARNNAPPSACDNLINFSGFNDAAINSDLDQGRVETDPAQRQAIYEDLTRRFADQAWNSWSWYTVWGIAAKPNVKGLLGPPLPDGHGMVSYSPSGKLFSIDLDHLKQTGESDSCKALGEIALTSDGNRALLTCPATGQLLTYNAHNGKPDTEITLTKGVDGIQWFPAVK